jgi:CBS-domain-containing membrane protein
MAVPLVRDVMSPSHVAIRHDAGPIEIIEALVRHETAALPVVDPAGGPVGTVARRDVLRASLRLSPAVRNELAGPLLRRVLARRAPHVRVDVADGVVTLTGWTERRSTARLAVTVARAVPGVVDVSDRVTYRHDDE